MEKRWGCYGKIRVISVGRGGGCINCGGFD